MKHGQQSDNHSCGAGTLALLNYFGKLNEEDSVKIILALVCALYVPSHQNWNKVLHTREIIFCKEYEFESLFCIQGRRWLLQPFLGWKKPSSLASKVLTIAFILKL